jgi:hypothetical protein
MMKKGAFRSTRSYLNEQGSNGAFKTFKGGSVKSCAEELADPIFFKVSAVGVSIMDAYARGGDGEMRIIAAAVLAMREAAPMAMLRWSFRMDIEFFELRSVND